MAFRNGAGPAQLEHAGEARKGTPGKRPSSRTHKAAQAHFAITDGRDARGTVDLVNGVFVAVDVNGSTIGRFSSLLAAVRALPGSAA